MSASRRRAALQLVKDLRIRTDDLDSAVATLSGGNQQKVVLGKALLTEPSVLLLDEPTRGIDVGAKLEVYELVNRLTAEGRGDRLGLKRTAELIGMSDRIMMLHEGRIGGRFRSRLGDARSAGRGRDGPQPGSCLTCKAT